MMKRAWSAGLGGMMFGAGLGLSGVANPVVINNFLDLASPHLDFTLFILFGVALVASTLAYQIVFRLRDRPLLVDAYAVPNRTGVDTRLVAGAAIFGVGWSLSGFCVGPALAALASRNEMALVYLVAVAAGSVLAGLVPGRER